jgi:hypothetical protein
MTFIPTTVKGLALVAQIVGAISTMFLGTASFVAAQAIIDPATAIGDSLGSVTGMGGLGVIGFALFRWLFAQYQVSQQAQREAAALLLAEKDRQIERLSAELREMQNRCHELMSRPRTPA